MARAELRLRIEDYPELVAKLRYAMAAILREEAEGEPEHTRRAMERTAARFEAGVRP